MAVLNTPTNPTSDGAILARTLRKTQIVLETIRNAALERLDPPGPVKPMGDSTIPTLPPFTTTSIITQLQSIGLSNSRAYEVSMAYLQMTDNLRKECDTSFQRSLQDRAAKGILNDKDAIDIEIQTWLALYTSRTRRWAETILNHARQSVSRQPRGSTIDHKKPAFNHEYTPLLDKYFEYNAYPSAPDREVLARKSMMTPRQIEVWFQNHRRRAKKDGKKLRRLSSDPLPLQLSLESLAECMPLFTVSENERKKSVEVDLSDTEYSDDDDLTCKVKRSRVQYTHFSLDSAPPPHAFPTPYPPSCDYDPFPTRTGSYAFPPPTWMRKATIARPSQPTVDIEELISEFAMKLVIRAKTSKKSRSPSSDLAKKHPWFAATYTVAPTAPHPAFIPSSPTVILQPIPGIQTIDAPRSRLHPFRSPSPYSQPASLVPRPRSGTPTRRKVASLPKRTPKNTSVAHRGASPAISEASPAPSSRSLSSGSRMSSFISNTPPSRRPSSSSSSSSTSSSTLTTPVYASTALPDSVPSISGVDFKSIDDLFGESTEVASPLDEFPAITTFSNPMVQMKEPFRFGFEPTSAGFFK